MKCVALLFTVVMVSDLVQECNGQPTVSTKKDIHCSNNDKGYIYNALDILNVRLNEEFADRMFFKQQQEQHQQQLREEVTKRKNELQQLQGQLQQQDHQLQQQQQQLNEQARERNDMQQQLQELQGQLQQLKCLTPGPPTIINGHVIEDPDLNNTPIRVKYQCNAQFLFDDGQIQKVLECDSSGQWNSTDLMCYAICPEPPSISNGSMVEDPGLYISPAEVIYQCDANFQFNDGLNQRVLQCESSGQWNSTDVDCNIATWPMGTFTLPKPKSGCPKPQDQWQEGWRYRDTEDSNDASQIIGHILDATRDTTSISWRFCTKNISSESYDWMPGKYCLMKKGDCPNGFLEGQLFWDDEDSNNANKFNGMMPDGEFGSNSLFMFCCREDGLTSNAIYLPTETPFVLLQKTNECQQVYGMSFTVESIYWDCEDSNNGNSMSGSYPYNDKGSHDIRLHFCVYQKL